MMYTMMAVVAGMGMIFNLPVMITAGFLAVIVYFFRTDETL